VLVFQQLVNNGRIEITKQCKMLCRVRCNLLHFQLHYSEKMCLLIVLKIRVFHLVDPGVLFQLVKVLETKSLM
jgi:hypothetical protein